MGFAVLGSLPASQEGTPRRRLGKEPESWPPLAIGEDVLAVPRCSHRTRSVPPASTIWI